MMMETSKNKQHSRRNKRNKYYTTYQRFWLRRQEG